jgi:ATP-dependent Clp endopeptidase proteolytic subunit ClpP
MTRSKINDRVEDSGDEESDLEDSGAIIRSEKPESRMIGLFGEVEEIKISQVIGMMIELSEEESEEPENSEDPESPIKTFIKPIEFIINTPGGSADDMFALYDIMRLTKDKCDIETFGIGKVMSAGVLLLAAGTKGKRKIGKNCRVMIHSVIGGSSGPVFNLENEIQEMKYMQAAYIKALSSETNMTFKELKKMIDRKVNIYISAEEAVKLGIADIIV